MNRKKRKTVKKESFEVAVKTACEGLLYPSETDAEILPVFGGTSKGGPREMILNEMGLKEPDAIEERTVVEFFARLTKIQDWFTQPEIEKADRFLKLQKLLEENLEDLTVLRTGRIQIDIYVVGIDEDGRVAGIKTKAVET